MDYGVELPLVILVIYTAIARAVDIPILYGSVRSIVALLFTLVTSVGAVWFGLSYFHGFSILTFWFSLDYNIRLLLIVAAEGALLYYVDGRLEWSSARSSNLQGTYCIVTGANSGMGMWTAARMARLGCTVIMASRNEGKNRKARSLLLKAYGRLGDGLAERLILAQLDLHSRQSITSFVNHLSTLLPKGEGINYLINNAGFLAAGNSVAGKLDPSFEDMILGHYLLMTKLHDTQLLQPNARIVQVASRAAYVGRLSRRKDLTLAGLQKSASPSLAYSRAKLLNIVLSKAWSRHYPHYESVSLHPGAVHSAFYSSLPWGLRQSMMALNAIIFRGADHSSRLLVQAAVTPMAPQHHKHPSTVLGVPGCFFHNGHRVPAPALSQKEELQDALLDLCASLIHQ
jgi:NAD(P)-dependent dehydrogenase (short-subunit alcohol dehydrogenase family)